MKITKDIKKYGLKVVIIGTLIKLLLFAFENMLLIWFLIDIYKKL